LFWRSQAEFDEPSCIRINPDGADFAKQIFNTQRALLLIASFAAMYFTRDFLLPVVLALFTALTLRPAMRHFAKHHTSPWLVVTVSFVLLAMVGFSSFYLLSWPVTS
jgi:predicted PurR-regulated permease PerM